MSDKYSGGKCVGYVDRSATKAADRSGMTGSAESIATGTEASPAQKLEDQISKAVDSDQYNPGDYPPSTRHPSIPLTKTSRDYLRESISIQNERSVDYDSEDGERSMGKTIIAFNAITGYDLTESEGWLLLQLLKDTRQWTSPTLHEDSALDCVSYAALKAESLNYGPTTKRKIS